MSYCVVFARKCPPPDETGGRWSWGPYAEYPIAEVVKGERLHGAKYHVRVTKVGKSKER